MKKIIDILPGFGFALLIALVASIIANLLPIHLIGASVFALFIGMLLNKWVKNNRYKSGLKFTSKKILKFAIILLGATLSLQTILQVGKLSLVVMFFTLLTCFGGGYFIGKMLGLNWKQSNLISAGTGICGGSAIAAIAPVIDADDTQIAIAISATFIFDMIMIVVFPIMGHFLNLSDMAYGLWAGTAVNDTSSVVAAGYAFSENAGDFATMVKLTRTLSIIPTVCIFALVNNRLKRKEKNEQNAKSKISTSSFPWFIIGFIALAIVNSFGLIPLEISSTLKELSKFLMVTALAAIGLNTSFKDISGKRPMIHGFIISVLVIIVAYIVEVCMGLI